MGHIKEVRAGWWNAFRPWSLTASIIPIGLGAVYSWQDGFFDGWLLLATLVGGCLLQAGTNLINTYGDFVRGVDTLETARRSPELVTGKLRPLSVYGAGIACFASAALVGLVLIWQCGWPLLIFGVTGILCGYSYTAGWAYKYRGFGLVMVFMLMGIVMVQGSYYVQAAAFRWDLLLIAIPNACLVTAILSGNELRDFFSDRRLGAGTLSVRLGYRASLRIYQGLQVAAYGGAALLFVAGWLPVGALLLFLTLPELVRNLRNSGRAVRGDTVANQRLVPLAFDLHWHFGFLLLFGCWLSFQG